MKEYRKDVADRNLQYSRLMDTRNQRNYKIETTVDGRNWTYRMMSLSSDYLDSVGRRWIDGNFCTEYRIK